MPSSAATAASFPAEYFSDPHPRPGPLLRVRAQLPRHQPALCPRPPERRIHLHRQPRVAHPAHLHPRRARPALFRHARRDQRQGRQPVPHRAHQLDRLVRLINDILDLERIQSGREPLAFRPVQLAESSARPSTAWQPVAEAAGVQLIHDTTQVEIAADPTGSSRCSPTCSPTQSSFRPPSSTISVTLRPGSSGVTLSVIDQGRGIPADKLEAIFGRFQQVDASDSRQKGGSGLGLAICRTIVLQHSGASGPSAIRARLHLPRFSSLPAVPPGRLEPANNGYEQEPRQGTVLLADANAATRAPDCRPVEAPRLPRR
jgi:signal transduction histidine kinase